jgi:hypothetical protein
MARNAASIGPPSASTALPAAIAASPDVIARGTRRATSEPPITATLKGTKSKPSLVSACRTARNIAGDVVAVSTRATRLPRARPRAPSA